ncbi:hypothetical protein ISCGN_021647 [Ixodes scapularis]
MDENLSRGYVQLGQSQQSWVDRVAARRRRVSAGVGGGVHQGEPPEDRCHCIYLALVLAGVGFLLPYNSFIIAVDYFQAKYPGTTIVFDMSLVYILMAFFAVVVNNLLVETLPLQVRITFGYLLSFGTLLFVALFEVYWDAFEHDSGYRANLVAVAVVALGCTVQQSSFYGYTSMLPSRYTQAVMTGESAAGVLVSASRILTKALLSDERVNTLLFFSVSVLVVFLCFVVHGLVLQRTRFVRFYLALCAPSSASDPSGEVFADDLLHKRILLEPTEDVGLVYILMAFFAVVVNNLLVETLPLQVRITFGYLLSFGTLLFVALFEVYWDAFEHDSGYRANLVAVAVVALGCTVQQSSFYGYTSMLPSRYTQAVMTGESAAGVLVSASRILTKALLSDERVNTLLFFSVSVLVVFLCFVVHGLVLQRTRFVRFYLALCAPSSASDPSGEAFADDLLHKRILLEPTEDVGLVL